MKKYTNGTLEVRAGERFQLNGVWYSGVTEGWLKSHGFEEVVPEVAESAPYVPTEAEKARQEIAELEEKLRQSDYKAIKFAEGWFTAEEYAPIKAERQALRDRINELQKVEDEV